ncbi:sigma-54-dependent Fis family transcriptional regulator [Flavobacteriaceae bacterium TP-CH-4]|uniref:Sigma-54-dependent Fis family transcriptional regulator n=1 Tax=Pelagihabitans pacificus TaxID=2696054 RepID=A0A967AQU5_9FLAO|nr:sigma-54 dependent transcriptional regulator [Pelagihabitans pacificus]NHF58716.1 sigma-54-dependent Fis family transcriptional regulator [Pelagihabitans pacificus]
MPNILIIEDDAAFCQMLQKFLTKHNYQVETSFTAPDAKVKFSETNFDVVLTDLRLPDYDGIQMLTDIKEVNSKTQVILMTGYAEVGSAVNAMKKGAYDYISKPFTPDEIVMVIENALKARPSESLPNHGGVAKTSNTNSAKSNPIASQHTITGTSEASRKLAEYIKLVAPTDMSVLITGESGTGKEVTAKAIHDQSKRKDFPFVAVDCGAIPKELATSEFFGHVKGSFTGAVEDKKGNFEAANGGTLFLDEVGNLSYDNQIQLLRALQERKIKRVGSTQEILVDVRIITATNEDLTELVGKGSFREDLYHRLNEFSIELPSLQDRFEDLMLFAEHFLEKANHNLDKNVTGFSKEVWNAFKRYHWPGNLRELQNIIKRSVLLTAGDEVQIEALPQEVRQPSPKNKVRDRFSKAEFEKDRIIQALKRTNFNKSEAAKLLQVTRKTLYNKISHYKLDL